MKNFTCIQTSSICECFETSTVLLVRFSMWFRHAPVQLEFAIEICLGSVGLRRAAGGGWRRPLPYTFGIVIFYAYMASHHSSNSLVKVRLYNKVNQCAYLFQCWTLLDTTRCVQKQICLYRNYTSAYLIRNLETLSLIDQSLDSTALILS